MFDSELLFIKLNVMFHRHVIDFEGSRHSGVIEYGCVTLEKGELVKTCSRICAPVGTINKLDRIHHGIAQVAVQKAPFTDEWSLFSGLRNRSLCAHNSAVEDGFFAQCGLLESLLIWNQAYLQLSGVLG